MARWRQVWSEEEQKYVLVPLDQVAAERDARMGIIVRGNFDAFRSHVDGTVIQTHRQLEEHNRRNGVVPVQEFDQSFFDRKARERQKLYQGEHSTQEKFRRKQEIHEIINRLERQ